MDPIPRGLRCPCLGRWHRGGSSPNREAPAQLAAWTGVRVGAYRILEPPRDPWLFRARLGPRGNQSTPRSSLQTTSLTRGTARPCHSSKSFSTVRALGHEGRILDVRSGVNRRCAAQACGHSLWRDGGALWFIKCALARHAGKDSCHHVSAGDFAFAQLPFDHTRVVVGAVRDGNGLVTEPEGGHLCAARISPVEPRRSRIRSRAYAAKARSVFGLIGFDEPGRRYS